MQLDSKRGNYLLKETSLSKALCLACKFDPKSPSGQAAMRYKEGRHAGFFAKTMHAVRQTTAVGLSSVKGVHSLGCDNQDAASCKHSCKGLMLESTAAVQAANTAAKKCLCAAMSD